MLKIESGSTNRRTGTHTQGQFSMRCRSRQAGNPTNEKRAGPYIGSDDDEQLEGHDHLALVVERVPDRVVQNLNPHWQFKAQSMD